MSDCQKTAVKESKDRVRSALINSLFDFPTKRITINLAPADLPKEGGRFDLAIAIGILAASGQIPSNQLDEFEFIGELALSGKLRGIHGILPSVIACGHSKRSMLIAHSNAEEASLCKDTPVFCGQHLLDICSHLHGTPLPQISYSPPVPREIPLDFSEVYGQEHAKRALEIAAAGGHNLLLYGPPGTGKTMLASRLPSIMPPLTQTQSIEVASIYSLCTDEYKQWQTPPFRHPHHTASAVALVGGGSYPKPGEISLAHHGVLFLDELPEFQRQVLEVLREPLESGEIRISRANAQLTFPAQFQFIAAMNPCPCGYLASKTIKKHTVSKKQCRCTQDQIQRYRQKISGPLLDRIDLHIPVNNLSISELSSGSTMDKPSESSEAIRERVIYAHARQQKRQGCLNARISSAELDKFFSLKEEEKNDISDSD